MKTSRRSLVLAFSALVVISSSVFSFGGDVYADALSMSQANSIIQQQKQVVAQKSDTLDTSNQTIKQLLDKKQNLAQQLQDQQKSIDDLNQKLADKKSAADAEAARVTQLQNMFVHVTSYSSGSAGNLYDPGYCTWYVKNKRPDLPNNLGNANMWYVNASAMGYSVGSAPKKGAVGVSTRGEYGHVVYVEGMTADGSSITISEMNYAGLYSLRTRTADPSEFSYIYEL